MARRAGRVGPASRRKPTQQPDPRLENPAGQPEVKAVLEVVRKDMPAIRRLAWLADWNREAGEALAAMASDDRPSGEPNPCTRYLELLARRSEFDALPGPNDRLPAVSGGHTDPYVVGNRLVICYLRSGRYDGPSGPGSLSPPKELWSLSLARKLANEKAWGDVVRDCVKPAWKQRASWYSQPWPPAPDVHSEVLGLVQAARNDGSSPGDLASLDVRLKQIIGQLVRAVLHRLELEESAEALEYFLQLRSAPKVVCMPHQSKSADDAMAMLRELNERAGSRNALHRLKGSPEYATLVGPTGTITIRQLRTIVAVLVSALHVSLTPPPPANRS